MLEVVSKNEHRIFYLTYNVRSFGRDPPSIGDRSTGFGLSGKKKRTKHNKERFGSIDIEFLLCNRVRGTVNLRGNLGSLMAMMKRN